MFSVFELIEPIEEHNYDRIPSKSSKMHCMLAARQCISIESEEVPDIIFAYGCKASEDDIETAVFAKTGLRTPWLKDSFSTFMKNFEKRVGIVTWELVPEAGRTIAEKEACLKAALDYLEFKKIEVVRSFSFSFQAIDPNDDLIDDEEMSDHIYLDTGFKSEWYPHRVSDCEEVPTLPTMPTIEVSLPTVPTTEVPLLTEPTMPTTEVSMPTEPTMPTTEVSMPTVPTVPTAKTYICPDCNMIFKNKYAKCDHKRRGKCSAK
jgi:hypothetical protein